MSVIEEKSNAVISNLNAARRNMLQLLVTTGAQIEAVTIGAQFDELEDECRRILKDRLNIHLNSESTAVVDAGERL